MTSLPFDDASGANDTLVCGLTPRGRIHVRAASSEDGPRVPPAAARRILDAFEVGRGHGVLYLGAALPGAELHPSLGYWRDFGRSLVVRVCGALDPTDTASVAVPDPDPLEIAAAVQAAPPMPGAESITPELLHALWLEVGEALAARAVESKDGVQGYLKAQSPIWNVVGRVCLHLAENRRDPDYPFAFIATYVREVSRRAAPSHLPLGRALEQYAGARNRGKLLALLAPLSRAAEDSEFIRELVDSGDVYHPLPWTPAEAHRFLQEVALYERAGLVVRTPDWWSARNRPRPRVSVTVGDHAPSMLGMKGLLDFDVALTVDGKTLSQKEIRALLASTEGLALIRGKWVEVDRDKLSSVLAQWREVQDRARLAGVGFGEAMRLLAGVGLEDPETEEDHRPEWSEVLAGKWLSGKLDTLRSPGLQADIDAGAGLTAELRPYQKRGVQWLWTLRGLQLGGCLADDMGLGKTLQVLAVLSLTLKTGEKETDLLVLPASLIDNWSQEIQRHAPFLKVLVAHPSYIPSAELKELSPGRVKAHHAVITTYGTVLRTEWMKKYPWRTVVLDEAQAIKNPAAKQTRAVKALPSKWRVVLTGTPVENRLGDLWSIFDFLNPGLLGSAKAFNRLAKSMASGEGGGYAPLRRLVAPYILRRLKTDKTVIADLPDKTEINAWCLLSRRQAALYQQSVEEMKKAIETLDGIQRRGMVLAFLLRFKQICNHPSHWLGDGRFDHADSGKFARLGELCESIAARQDKVLVFTQFREMTAPLSGYLAEVFGCGGLVLHGGTPVRRRQDLVKRFQEDDRIPFMVLSLKAGGTGLNLTAASHVIHFDRWWNPAVENQATDRAFRIGQKKNVLVHKFVCRGTVEERIHELMAAKQGLSDEILSGGAESSLTEMSNEELMSVVSLDLAGALESAG